MLVPPNRGRLTSNRGRFDLERRAVRPRTEGGSTEGQLPWRSWSNGVTSSNGSGGESAGVAPGPVGRAGAPARRRPGRCARRAGCRGRAEVLGRGEHRGRARRRRGGRRTAAAARARAPASAGRCRRSRAISVGLPASASLSRTSKNVLNSPAVRRGEDRRHRDQGVGVGDRRDGRLEVGVREAGHQVVGQRVGQRAAARRPRRARRGRPSGSCSVTAVDEPVGQQPGRRRLAQAGGDDGER